SRRVAVGAEQAATFERRERAAIAVLADAVEDDVEPAWHEAREVFALVVDCRRAELADQGRMLTAAGAPQLQAGDLPEHEQRLTDSAGSSLHKHALAWLHPGCAV